ncbi:MAG: IPT/TIG domain-containing protein [Dehalococcoidia bacterium]|nr:IPT/TIG domain-containing protein [Dehalococcoidia bacterium]
MKLLFRLFIVLALCVLAVPFFTSPVQADGPEEAQINVSPATGPVETSVVLTGENFVPETTIYIHYERAEDDWVLLNPGGTYTETGDDLSVLADIPESAYGDHEIRAGQYNNPVYDIIANTTFSVTSSAEIISPSSGKGHVGDQVTLKVTGGEADADDISLRYYYTSSSYETVADNLETDEYGSLTITFTVPASTRGSHDLKLYEDDVLVMSAPDFEVLRDITASPSTGFVGDSVTASGTGFSGGRTDIKLKFDGETVLSNIASDSRGSWGPVNFVVPSHIQGTYDIEAYLGSATTSVASTEFTLSPKIILNPAASTSSPGHVGQVVNVSGSGFSANIPLTLSYDGATIGSVTTSATGTFSGVSFTATHTQSTHTTNHPVQATYGASAIASTNFVMESTAPAKITPLSPLNGKRTGVLGNLLGKVRPTFTWTTISDTSGINKYELQIYQVRVVNGTTNVTPVFSSPLVILPSATQAGTNSTSYSLAGEYSLPYGSYQWQIRAIDGAMNTGSWSDVQTFRAGYMPQWAAIAVVVLAIALIVGLVFYIRSRSRYYY